MTDLAKSQQNIFLLKEQIVQITGEANFKDIAGNNSNLSL